MKPDDVNAKIDTIISELTALKSDVMNIPTPVTDVPSEVDVVENGQTEKFVPETPAA